MSTNSIQNHGITRVLWFGLATWAIGIVETRTLELEYSGSGSPLALECSGLEVIVLELETDDNVSNLMKLMQIMENELFRMICPDVGVGMLAGSAI